MAQASASVPVHSELNVPARSPTSPCGIVLPTHALASVATNPKLSFDGPRVRRPTGTLFAQSPTPAGCVDLDQHECLRIRPSRLHCLARTAWSSLSGDLSGDLCLPFGNVENITPDQFANRERLIASAAKKTYSDGAAARWRWKKLTTSWIHSGRSRKP
jgi:hypothetical protein